MEKKGKSWSSNWCGGKNSEVWDMPMASWCMPSQCRILSTCWNCYFLNLRSLACERCEQQGHLFKTFFCWKHFVWIIFSLDSTVPFFCFIFLFHCLFCLLFFFTVFLRFVSAFLCCFCFFKYFLCFSIFLFLYFFVSLFFSYFFWFPVWLTCVSLFFVFLFLCFCFSVFCSVLWFFCVLLFCVSLLASLLQ